MKKTVVTMLALISLLTGSLHAGQAESAPPFETPFGRLAQEYFKAFNADDDQAMKEYMSAYYAESSLQSRPVEQRLQVYRQMKAEMRSLTPVKLLESGADWLNVLAKTGAEEWMEFRFEFAAGTPLKLKGIRIEDSDASAATEPRTPLTEAEMLAALRAYLDEEVKADRYSGTVLIARGDKVVFSGAYGKASREYDVPNRMSTRFNLGSMNKRFTKVAIYQMAEKGLLSLDDTIGRHLPDYPNKEAAAKVRISHLLEMTSGIGDFFGPKYAATPKDQIRTISDYLPLFASEPLLFAPGTDNRYSNGGYIVLGAVIEKVTGQSYYDYVRERIFKPAGMAHTESFEADVPVPDVAMGYTRRWDDQEHSGEPRRTNIYTRPARGSSAGGGYSTAEDMFAFGRALLANKLLGPAYTQFLFTGALPAKGAPLKPRTELPGYAIAGGAPGINSMMEWMPRGDVTIVVMSNLDPPAAMDVGARIRRLLARVAA